MGRVGRRQSASFYESQVLEFKETGRSVKDTLSLLADAAVCLANAEGGTIVLGVNDKATTRAQALVGVEPSYSLDGIRRGIFDGSVPSLTCNAYEWQEDRVRLVVIDVPPGVLPCATSSGKATRRLGKECRPFTPDQQLEMVDGGGQVELSAESSGAKVSDLSKVEIERLRQLLSDAGSGDLARLSGARLLDALRLRTDGDVTNAAVLLLGTEEMIVEVIPNYGYSYQYRPTAGTEATSRFRQGRPLVAALEAILDAVNRGLELRPVNLAGGVQLQLVDYPASAVRELVVNAFIHRSYEAPGSVDVEHTPERLSVISPGGLVMGVTPQNILTHPSTPRHKLLAEVVSRIRLAERTGQGIDRAYREMLRAGKEPPMFEDSGLVTRAILSGGIGNDAFVRFLSDIPEELAQDVEILLTVAALRSRQSLDAKRLASVIQRSVVEAQDVLERLASDDVAILESTRSTVRRQYPTYRLRGERLASLSRAVTYHRRTIDQTDQKVIDHVREYEFVTNRTLQRLFDVNLYAARNLLSDFQSRGILRKIGTAKGGPGVRYGPGAKFPAS